MGLNSSKSHPHDVTNGGEPTSVLTIPQHAHHQYEKEAPITAAAVAAPSLSLLPLTPKSYGGMVVRSVAGDIRLIKEYQWSNVDTDNPSLLRATCMTVVARSLYVLDEGRCQIFRVGRSGKLTLRCFPLPCYWIVNCCICT
jgi:hypothetical protein